VPAPTDTAPAAVTDLRTERLVDPIGVADARPLLSWRLTGSGTHRQASFRVRVTADPADPRDDSAQAVWESGSIAGWATVDVPYSGHPLAAGARYRWSVQVTTDDASTTAWAEPATFELAPTLHAGDDFGAAWITSADEHGGGSVPTLDPNRWTPELRRIWLPSGAQAGASATLRTTVRLADGVRVSAVQLLAVGAADLDVRVNGRTVNHDGTQTTADLSAWIQGDNALEVRATAGAREIPGLLVSGVVWPSVGEPVRFGTDDTWTVSTDGARWALAASVGANGDAPRGREPESHRPSPYLRKDFSVAGDASEVVRARLYATALGVYQVSINGVRVGRHELAPGWTDYRQRVPYQTYDVSDLITSGDNTIGAVLGDGWYAGHIGWVGPFRYGTQRSFLARLEIEHADGSTTVVATDDSWTAGTGAIRYSDQQMGEVVEPSAGAPGWDRPGFAAAGWAPVVTTSPVHGPLEAEVNPPVSVQHTLSPVSVTRRDDGRYLVDFGQNLVGRVRLRLAQAPTGKIIVAHAERLDDRGELYVEALRSARCTDEFLVQEADLPVELAPTFSWRGFQYAEFTGLSALSAEDVTAEVLHAAMEPIGDFACSDEHLTKLQANIVWGQRGNFLSVPTDCPQRDERLGWTGDAQAFASTAAFNYDVRGFFRKWMRDVRDAQGGNGAVTHVAPDPLSVTDGVGSPYAPASAGSAGWGDAVVIVPDALYRTYGDARIAHESLDAIGAWLRYLDATSVDGIRGKVAGIGPADGFGDWLAITDTPKDLISTAFVAYAAKIAAELAADLGEPERVADWAAQYGRVRSAFRARWVRGGGRLVPGTQTAYVLALQVELLDPDEEAGAVEHLVRDIRSRNTHLATGFLGTPYLLKVLADRGRADVAFDLLMQDTYPSWLYPVVHGGATTMWERWDSWSDSRGFQDPGMTSFNHYAYGCVGEWLYRSVAGLAPGSPGYGHTVVKPMVGGGLTWVSGSLETVHGRLASRWEIAGDRWTLALTVPPNTTAEVWLPRPGGGHSGKPVTVGGGEHTFEVDWAPAG
jgi:alpha-L-rhamnosidase